MLNRFYWLFLILGAVIGVALGIKKLREPSDPQRRILPDPLQVKHIDDDYVTKKELDAAMRKVEEDVDKRFDQQKVDTDNSFAKQDAYLKDKFHKLDNDLNGIKLEAKNWHEQAAENFQEIEGSLGELRASQERDYAATVRTEQTVQRLTEKLPETIANAISRVVPRKP